MKSIPNHPFKELSGEFVKKPNGENYLMKHFLAICLTSMKASWDNADEIFKLMGKISSVEGETIELEDAEYKLCLDAMKQNGAMLSPLFIGPAKMVFQEVK